MAKVTIYTLDGRPPNAATKKYLKYSDAINEYILARVDYRLFLKNHHSKIQSTKTHILKFKNQNLLIELEKDLKRKGISMKRIERVCAVIYAHSSEMFDKLPLFDKLLVENFYANAKTNRRLMVTDSNATPEVMEAIKEKKKKRSNWVKNGKIDLHHKMAGALLPYIMEHGKSYIKIKYYGNTHDDATIEKFINIIFTDKWYRDIVDEITANFKKSYGSLEDACKYFKIDISKL